MIPNGTMLYVIGGKGMSVFDMTDKKAPTQVGDRIDTECLTHDGDGAAFLEGTNLVIVGGKGMKVFSVAEGMPEPDTNRVKTGVLSLDGGCDVQIRDGIAFIAGGHGLMIL